MSNLEELIERLCPDGVEYKKIGELVDYEQPGNYIVSSTKYSDEDRVIIQAKDKELTIRVKVMSIEFADGSSLVRPTTLPD